MVGDEIFDFGRFADPALFRLQCELEQDEQDDDGKRWARSSARIWRGGSVFALVFGRADVQCMGIECERVDRQAIKLACGAFDGRRAIADRRVDGLSIGAFRHFIHQYDGIERRIDDGGFAHRVRYNLVWSSDNEGGFEERAIIEGGRPGSDSRRVHRHRWKRKHDPA